MVRSSFNKIFPWISYCAATVNSDSAIFCHIQYRSATGTNGFQETGALLLKSDLIYFFLFNFKTYKRIYLWQNRAGFNHIHAPSAIPINPNIFIILTISLLSNAHSVQWYMLTRESRMSYSMISIRTIIFMIKIKGM